jgi:hypothetical protein
VQQQRKLHVQEKDEQQQKQQLGHLLPVLRDALAALRDAQHQSEDALAALRDAQHQSEDAVALKEKDVDKLPNPSFFQFFILTNCKLSLIRQHQ